jgi:two-component system response regulator BaeR
LHEYGDEAFDRAIDSHVKNIRKKIGHVLPDAALLHSVYGVGYKIEI